MNPATDDLGATLFVVGLSRETAPVDVRERASLDTGGALKLLRSLRLGGVITEAIALSTCNRTEVYAVAAPGWAPDAPSVVRETLSCQTSISREELVQLGYVRVEEQAIEHLFGVVAGLEAEPLLAELRRRAEQVRRLELDRAIARTPDLSEAELERLDAVTRSLIKKLLHEPAHRIRLARHTSEGRAQVDALCDLFAARGVVSARTGPDHAAAPRIPRTRARTPATSHRVA